VYRVSVGKPEGKDHWGALGVDGWIILRLISRRWNMGIWTGLADGCECVKCGEFLD